MRDYLRNIGLYLAGLVWIFTKPPKWKDGWTPLKFLVCLYWWDHGLGALCGMGVQPLSRWAYDRREHEPWRTLNNVLDRFDKDHGKNAGGLLWGSRPCRDRARYVATTLTLVCLTVAIATAAVAVARWLA